MRFHPNRIPAKYYWLFVFILSVVFSFYLYVFKTVPSIKTSEKLKTYLEYQKDTILFYQLTSEAYQQLYDLNYDNAMMLITKADSIVPQMETVDGIKEAITYLKRSKEKTDSILRVEKSLKSILQTQTNGMEDVKKTNQVQAQIITMIQNKAMELDSLYMQQTRRTSELEKEINALEGKYQQLQFANDAGKEVSYFGEVDSGKANGYGIGIFEGKSTYQGSWKNNQRHGRGKYIWANGDVYEGDFKADKRHGSGTYLFETGEKYVGDWANDLRQGRGALYASDGTLIIDGPWFNDRYQKKEDTLSR